MEDKHQHSQPQILGFSVKKNENNVLNIDIKVVGKKTLKLDKKIELKEKENKKKLVQGGKWIRGI